MKPKISKEQILKKYSLDTACRVWYKNQKGYINYRVVKVVIEEKIKVEEIYSI